MIELAKAVATIMACLLLPAIIVYFDPPKELPESLAQMPTVIGILISALLTAVSLLFHLAVRSPNSIVPVVLQENLRMIRFHVFLLVGILLLTVVVPLADSLVLMIVSFLPHLLHLVVSHRPTLYIELVLLFVALSVVVEVIAVLFLVYDYLMKTRQFRPSGDSGDKQKRFIH